MSNTKKESKIKLLSDRKAQFQKCVEQTETTITRLTGNVAGFNQQISAIDAQIAELESELV